MRVILCEDVACAGAFEFGIFGLLLRVFNLVLTGLEKLTPSGDLLLSRVLNNTLEHF